MTTQDRLAVEWETVKHLIPDGELKTFICRAIMLAMEKWKGGEPPRVKPMSVTVDNPPDPETCDHEFQFTDKVTACQKCGVRLEKIQKQWDDDMGIHPVSPYAGGSIG